MAQQTKGETKPLFVYWFGAEFKDNSGYESVNVSWVDQETYDTYPHHLIKFRSGNNSSLSEEVIEAVREMGHMEDDDWVSDMEWLAPITLTVEKGKANTHPKAKEPFYWNVITIEQGHDSELWPDGASEGDKVPAPKIVQQAPADDMTGAIDRDELADYINKESGDHGQHRMTEAEMRDFGAQLGNAANTASRIYSAYITSSETVVEFNEDRFAALIVKNFKAIAKAKQIILNERSAR